MQRDMNNRFLLMLAILVGLLSFGPNYGFSTHADGNQAYLQSHSDLGDCADTEHSVGCVGMSAERPLHDNGCSDHCDSSFGSQLCINTEYTFELPSGHLFQTHATARLTDPVPTTLLRPPQNYS